MREPGRRSSGTPPPAPRCTGAAAPRTRSSLGPPRRSGPRTSPPAARRRSTSTDRSWVMKIIASRDRAAARCKQLRAPGPAPSRRARWSARRRSAARVAGQRHRDHHPLPLATGELVRVVVGAPGGMPTCSSRSAAAVSSTVVSLDRLVDLVADALHRVERVLRALEHDRGLRPRTARSRPGFIARRLAGQVT